MMQQEAREGVGLSAIRTVAIPVELSLAPPEMVEVAARRLSEKGAPKALVEGAVKALEASGFMKQIGVTK